MASALMIGCLALALVGTSMQQATGPPVATQWATTAFPGYQGTGQGFRGFQGSPGNMYGFQIVDAPDRYGYVSNYPGGRTSFFLLGPNRGPGQQSWRGSAPGGMRGGGGYQASYRPSATASAGAAGWRQPGAW